MPISSKLWAQHYPTLPDVLDDEPNIPKRNVFARNISAGGIWDDIHAGTRSYQVVRDNLVFDNDPKWIQVVRDAAGQPKELVFKEPAAVSEIGFEPLPLSKIGVYKDRQRASWPVEHQVDQVRLPHDTAQ
jgi:hypothetical protein